MNVAKFGGQFLTFWSPTGLFFWVIFNFFGALMSYFWSTGRVFKNCFGVYSCSWATLIFYFFFNSDIWFWINFGVVFYFWGPNGIFLGSMWGSTTVLGSTHVVEQLSFLLFLSILTYEFDLIFGSFLLFVALMGYFSGVRKVRQRFWGLLMYLNNFHFLCFFQLTFWGPNGLFLGLE